MSIEEIRSGVRMPAKVDLENSVRWDRIDVVKRAEAVVMRTDEHVVDIEENAAIGSLGHFAEKFVLGDCALPKLEIGRRVFQSEGDTKLALHSLHALHDV